MKKAAQAFRTISEVSEWLDTPTHVLRFWESKFNQIKPVKRAGGRRYYRPSDMQLLGGIKELLHNDAMTIKGVQKILSDKGVKYVSSLSPELEMKENRKRRGSAKGKAEAKQSTNDATKATEQNGDASIAAKTASDISNEVVQDDVNNTNKTPVATPQPVAAKQSGTRMSILDASPIITKASTTRSDLSKTSLLEVENLYYELKKVRNRMKRSLVALS